MSAAVTQLQLSEEQWAISPYPPAQTREATNSHLPPFCSKTQQ